MQSQQEETNEPAPPVPWANLSEQLRIYVYAYLRRCVADLSFSEARAGVHLTSVVASNGAPGMENALDMISSSRRHVTEALIATIYEAEKCLRGDESKWAQVDCNAVQYILYSLSERVSVCNQEWIRACMECDLGDQAIAKAPDVVAMSTLASMRGAESAAYARAEVLMSAIKELEARHAH